MNNNPIKGYEIVQENKKLNSVYIPQIKADMNVELLTVYKGYKFIIEEYKIVKLATIHLFKSFSDKMLLNIGQANNAPASVRAIGFIITGHEIHHINIIKARYSLF